MGADTDLLWAAARQPADVDGIRANASAADVARVLDTAGKHRVLGIVLTGLRDAGVALDRSADPFVKQEGMLKARAALAIPLATERAIGPLDAAGLRPLVLKGLSIARRYPAPAVRPMDDIDLLLPREALTRASTVLEDAGWRHARHRDRDPHYDVMFVHPDAPNVPLELHYGIARWAERAPGLNGAELWNARVPGVAYGCDVWTLPPELEFILLVFHAAKAFHVFRRLLWIVDLVMLDRSATLDWDEIARRATAIKRRVALAVALRLASRLGASPPASLMEVPPALERSGVLDELLDPAEPFSTTFRPRWLAYAMLDGGVPKLRHAVGDVVRPSGRTPRRLVVRDLAGMALRGVPRYVRASLGG